MALTEPLSVTIAGAPHSLPRVSTGPNTSSYANSDGTVKVSVASQYGKRSRRTVRLTHTKIAADPFTSDNQQFSLTSYIVFDTPVTGYTVAQQKEVIDGFIAALSASSGAMITKVLGGEN